MGEGAGDIIGQINTAFAWSEYHDRPVHLNVHWGSRNPQDYKVVETDTESVAERYMHVYDRMKQGKHEVTMSHEFNSDQFAFLDSLFADDVPNEVRRDLKPARWLFESGPLTNDPIHGRDPKGDIPFLSIGGPEWEWKDAPEVNKKIVFWSSRDNKDSIKSYKDFPFTSQHWREVEKTLMHKFPDYEIVKVSYRDDFREVYQHIRGCSFCIGYDGMWHTIARNFGKLFITVASDIGMIHNVTNPMCAAFRYMDQFFQFLQECAETEGYLQREQELAMKYHQHNLWRISRGEH